MRLLCRFRGHDYVQCPNGFYPYQRLVTARCRRCGEEDATQRRSVPYHPDGFYPWEMPAVDERGTVHLFVGQGV